MRKYIIEVTEEGIKKTFIDGDKKYEEMWERTSSGSKTTGDCLSAQMEDAGYDDELVDILDEDDLDELWRYLEDNNEESAPDNGKLIKNLATCENCNIELLSIYETGVWGFSKIKKDELGFFTKCPLCDNSKRYAIDEDDIKPYTSG